MSALAPRILPVGDRAFLIELEPVLSPDVNGRARALATHLRERPGVVETVAALRSTLVIVDPFAADLEALVETAEQLAVTLPPESTASGRVLAVPTVYGGEAGPDLEAVAEQCGLSSDQVVREHASVEYIVYMLGFTPGYPYLGVLPPTLRADRLPTPRLRVPAGSVAIADALCGIYPLESPGGWRLIGRTALAIYDPREADPVLLRPGDRVRFVPTTAADFPPPLRAGARLPRPRRPVFEVRSGGLYTTLQDLGRPGYRQLGIPGGGAMDPLALQVANLAVGNAPDAPAVELTAPGPVLRALADARLAVGGADLSASLDGSPLEPAVAVPVRAGQTVRFGAPRAGMWAYLAIAGGFDVRRVLGSASTYVPGLLGGCAGRRLRAGDVLGRADGAGAGEGSGRAAMTRAVPGPAAVVTLPGAEATIRVIPGPQDEWLAEEARRALWKEVYTVSVQADRAGVRLNGLPLAHRISREFLSDGLLPGAVQVPSGGRPIVIMPDGPATGGYPTAAVVISADLRLIAQARPGTRLRFTPVTMEEALDALRRQRAGLTASGNRG